MGQPHPMDERQQRVARLAARAGDLQAMPLVVTRALQSIDDPDSNVDHLAAILNTDQTIVGRLIGLANSALYSGSGRFVTVREAIIRLGFRPVRDLLFATVVSGLAKAPSRLYELGPNQLWLHSLATGISARVIAEELGLPDPERGYVAGLLHDVGRAVLERSLTRAEIAAVRELVHEKEVSYQVAEEEVLGLTHSEVGAYRLTAWGVGPELVKSVAAHHAPPPGSLSALVHAADVLALKVVDLGGDHPGWSYPMEPGTLEGLGGSAEFRVDEPGRLNALVDRVRAALSQASALA